MIDLLKDPINTDAEVHKMYRVFLIRKNSHETKVLQESVEDENTKENFSELIIKLHSINDSYDGTIAILKQVRIVKPWQVMGWQ